jgi:hypothetical protein
VASPTPSIRFSAFSTRPTQEAQVIPTTGSETVAGFGVEIAVISAPPFAWMFIVNSIGDLCCSSSALSSHWKVNTQFHVDVAP